MTKRNYSLITTKAQLAVTSYILRRATHEQRVDPKAEKAELESLIEACIPHGSLRSAAIRQPLNGLCVAVQVQGKKQQQEVGPGEGIRIIDPEAFIAFLALTFFGGHSHIKNTSPRLKPVDDALPPAPDGHPNHYVYIHQDGIGQPWQHVIANAKPGQEVKLGADHKDLRMVALTLVPSTGRSKNDRYVAVSEALRLHQVAANNAAAKGSTLGITRAAYEALLWACFKLLDEAHGHLLNRVTDK
jgi:hypothetical protein